jgi:hypothetical protein
MPTLTFSEIASKVRGAFTSYALFATNPFRYLVTRSPSSGRDAVDSVIYDSTGATELTSPLRSIFAPSTPPLYIDLAPICEGLFDIDPATIDEATPVAYAAGNYRNVRIGWKDATAGSYTVESEVYTLIAGAVQIGEDTTYGQNAAAYCPAPTVPLTGKFLTMFAKPKVYSLDGEVFAPQLFAIITQDVLDYLTANPGYSVAIRQRFDGGAWQYDLFNANAVGVIACTLFDDGAGTAFYTEVENASSIEFQLVVVDAVNAFDIALTDAITLEKLEVCINPYVLRWKNSKGGFDVWCFEGDNEESHSATTDGYTSVAPADFATQQSLKRSYGKRAENELSARAVNIKTADALALLEIAQSPCVQIWKGGFWIYCDVEGDNAINRRLPLQSLEFDVILQYTITVNS